MLKQAVKQCIFCTFRLYVWYILVLSVHFLLSHICLSSEAEMSDTQLFTGCAGDADRKVTECLRLIYLP